MLIDLEKKQLRRAPLSGEPSADDIESVAVTDKAILLHGAGKKRCRQDLERRRIVGNG
jgi:hypothetical protein